MNTIQDTINTLLPEASPLVSVIMDESVKMFKDIGKVNPAMFAYTGEEKEPIHIEDVDIMDEYTKPIVWARLRRLREQYLVTAFVSEVWMVRQKGEEWDGVMPRDNPARTEHVMVSLWQGSRVVTFVSDITRNPSAMGEWKVLFDSQFPPKDGADRVSGAMMEGNPCSAESN